MKILKPLKQNPQNMLHDSDSGMVSGVSSPNQGEAVGILGVTSPLICPFPTNIKSRKKESVETMIIPLILNTFHHQRSNEKQEKNHGKMKKEKENN